VISTSSLNIGDLPKTADELQQMAASIQALSHPIRLKTLLLIGKGELTVTEITGAVGTTQSNVSQHLRTLKFLGVISVRQDHNKSYCSIEDPRLLLVLDRLRSMYQL